MGISRICETIHENCDKLESQGTQDCTCDCHLEGEE